jgi:hypothetical protein
MCIDDWQSGHRNGVKLSCFKSFEDSLNPDDLDFHSAYAVDLRWCVFEMFVTWPYLAIVYMFYLHAAHFLYVPCIAKFILSC